MLKKLIKNEFKENYKEMLVLYGISLIAFCLLGLFIRLDMFEFLTILVIPAVGSMYCIMIFIFININRSFNKKLFSKEGYLTFSLPVKMGNLLFSKYLSNIIWMFASFIVLLIDVVFLLIFAVFAVFAFGGLISDYNSRKRLSRDYKEKLVFSLVNANSVDELTNIVKSSEICS